MSKLLHIQSSPNLMTSVTRRLSETFVARWCETHDKVDVETLDLGANPLPHFGTANMAAMVTPPENFSPETRAAVKRSGELIGQLMASDVVLIAVPMVNFTIPTQLKTWIDNISIPQKTFRYSGPGQVEGLVKGKKVFVIEARGMDYSSEQGKALDFQEPLLKWQLSFLGMTDITFIRAEGMRMKPDEADTILERAEQEVLRHASV